MSEIINLRQARKAKARAEKETQAATNRVYFGTPKALRKLTEAKAGLAEKQLDGHKISTETGTKHPKV